MLAVLRAFLELGPVEVIAVLLGHGRIVFLDARAHLGEQRLGEGLLPFHLGFEIGVFRLHVGKHIGIVHGGIGLVVEPVVGVFHGDAVDGVGVGALFGDGRLDLASGIGGGGSGHSGRILGWSGHHGRCKGGGGKPDGKRRQADRTEHGEIVPVAARPHARGWKDAGRRPMMAVLVTQSCAARACAESRGSTKC